MCHRLFSACIAGLTIGFSPLKHYVKEQEGEVSVGVALLEGELPPDTTVELSLMAKSGTAVGK